jgi:hypothetical protein
MIGYRKIPIWIQIGYIISAVGYKSDIVTVFGRLFIYKSITQFPELLEGINFFVIEIDAS